MATYTLMGVTIDNPKDAEFELTSPFEFGFKVVLTDHKGATKVLRNVTEVHHNFPSDFAHPHGTRVAIESDLHSRGGTYVCRDYTAIAISKDEEMAPEHD